MLKVQELLVLMFSPILLCGCAPDLAQLPADENGWHEGCRSYDERLLPIARDRLNAEIRRLASYSPDDFSYGEICKGDDGSVFFTIVLKQRGEKHPLANDPAFSIEGDGSLTLIKQE
jgi:hypothetical protein